MHVSNELVNFRNGCGHDFGVIRPHHSTSYVDVAYCYRRGSVVCLSVTLLSPAKTAQPIEIPFELKTRVGLRNHVLDEVHIRSWEGAILIGRGASHRKV